MSIDWSTELILRRMQSESVSELETLVKLASSGEIRDFDDLFTNPSLYTSLTSMLKSAWKAHDHAHLGGVSDDEHENFIYEQEREAERQGKRGIIDDEEDEAPESAARIAKNLARDSTWDRLHATYTFITRSLTVPEFDISIASRRGAFDSNFISAVVTRFEPKFHKKGASHNPMTDNRPPGSLSQVTGVGGVAMGSLGAVSPAAKISAQLAHVPASILSMVGIGVKHAEPDSPTPQELSILRGFLHTLYMKFFHLRAPVRSLMANFIQRFLRTSTYPQGINEILNVYGAIVKGFQRPIHPQHRDFLLKHLLPLHQPNQMHNELSPVMGVYHESLVYVLIQFLEKDSSLCETILNRILLQWPQAKAANSPKEVLLLHECEKILEYCSTNNGGSSSSNGSPSTTFHRIISAFLPYLIQCISSYNHRVAERALQMWQNDKFLSLCSDDRQSILPLLLPCLVSEDKHWNKSVNKMKGIVLGLFREMDLVLFTRVAHENFLREAKAKNTPADFTPSQSLVRIDALIAQLKPAEVAVQESPEQKLLATQVRVAASLPVTVKYSDFVFGHVLGEGSFSQVRYAKLIERGQLPSSWKEFAVKVISKELVAQQKYERNVEREIRIMNSLAHENINRLVALCDNATNTYLVLEYAPKGDLHTHISKLGSLDADSARFVAAEIIRAMEEIHKNKIVYVDLKPENVLVHQSGHVKLSDFGSSRLFDEIGLSDTEERLEGTADYLAPEVLRGETISPASDLWAFACVLYQLLAGRTPIWIDDLAPAPMDTSSSSAADASLTPAERAAKREAEMNAHNAAQKSHLLSKMVAFEEQEEKYPENFDPAAKDLVEKILRAEPSQRVGVVPLSDDAGKQITRGVKWSINYAAIKGHPFFNGIDWANLHTLPAPSLAGGQVAPAPDATWARRKNSIMWAPMPKSYTFAEGSITMEPITEDLAKESSSVNQSRMAGGGGNHSLRAQMFSNKTGSIAAPRFSSLKEAAAEEEEGEDDEDEDIKLNEEDEESEEDGDGDSVMSSPDGSSLQTRMMTAPLPLASQSAKPSSRKASSRAPNPNAMAVVESAHGEEEDHSHNGIISAALPPRPAIRTSLGLRSHQPPSASAASSGLPPAGPMLHSSALPPKPSTMFSSVPRADPTAGPSSLGMGLGVRKMGGNSTASALLARMNKSATNPAAQLP